MNNSAAASRRAVIAAQGADDLLALHVGLSHLARRLVGDILALGIDRRGGIGRGGTLCRGRQQRLDVVHRPAGCLGVMHQLGHHPLEVVDVGPHVEQHLVEQFAFGGHRVIRAHAPIGAGVPPSCGGR